MWQSLRMRWLTLAIVRRRSTDLFSTRTVWSTSSIRTRNLNVTTEIARVLSDDSAPPSSLTFRHNATTARRSEAAASFHKRFYGSGLLANSLFHWRYSKMTIYRKWRYSEMTIFAMTICTRLHGYLSPAIYSRNYLRIWTPCCSLRPSYTADLSFMYMRIRWLWHRRQTKAMLWTKFSAEVSRIRSELLVNNSVAAESFQLPKNFI